ncbi:hypothetical protein AgCh_000707 [Apium graveolens]
MIDKAVDAVWKRQAFLKKPNASGGKSQFELVLDIPLSIGTPASSVIQKAPKGYHVWIMEILMTFFITLYKLLHSVASRVTKKLPEKSSDQNISPQEFAFDTMPRKEIFPSLSTPTSTETDLLSSVLKRLGELEEIVDTLKAKPSEMPYEKEELLNVVVCRVDALEAELISTKKLIIRSHEGPDATEKRPGFGGMNEGVPLMRAMYGALGEDLVVQSAVLQSIIWIMILLFMLEVRRARRDFDSVSAIEMSGKDLEGNHRVQEIDVSVVRPSAWAVMKTVLGKLAKNPNCYACIAGLAWAFLAARWHFDMPSIMEGSILIMSKAGTGTSMFCMASGLFMASNDKIIACGAKATMVGMILRFIAGPLSVGIACIAVGLRGDALRIAIVQSALPQAVATFIYAKEYGLHTNVISTAVIFGTVVSLPILIGYFAVLDLIQI